MAKKARKKKAVKAKKKSATKKKVAKKATKAKRKTIAKRKSKSAAKKQSASPPKPRGILAKIVAEFEAVIDTLADAERLHRKMEPKISREPE